MIVDGDGRVYKCISSDGRPTFAEAMLHDVFIVILLVTPGNFRLAELATM